MKKILSVILSIAMLFALSSTVFAADSGNGTKKSVSLGDCTFEITEKVNADYTTVRTYTNDATASRSAGALDLEKTKALLAVLGMTDDEINAFPLNTLIDFANAKDIVVSTSYTKSNDDTKAVVGIPAQTAIEEATALSIQQMEYFLNNEHLSEEIPMQTFGNISNTSTTPGEFKDTYMKMTHAAIHSGGGSYKFTVNAEWLTMPFFRGYDSIGSCAMNGTVTPNTSSGKYWYTIQTITLGKISTSSSGDILITDRYNKEKGNWYGSAGVFNLPNDIHSPDGTSSILYTNLKAYYEYKGNVTFPTLASNFNTAATYSHATIKLSIGSPSISIDTTGAVAVSIGLDIVGSMDIRVAELEVKYKP